MQKFKKLRVNILIWADQCKQKELGEKQLLEKERSDFDDILEVRQLSEVEMWTLEETKQRLWELESLHQQDLKQKSRCKWATHGDDNSRKPVCVFDRKICGLGVDIDDLKIEAEALGCKAGDIPFVYLGIKEYGKTVCRFGINTRFKASVLTAGFVGKLVPKQCSDYYMGVEPFSFDCGGGRIQTTIGINATAGADSKHPRYLGLDRWKGIGIQCGID
ncbi:hypothetical protein L1987_17049 [Smallanthus sonchifolius]|uniref:Uncharacterized protein n=1 Tax=Smallanthus sonchifolius TaxID=185202 RepID=A0ACB9IWX9_9ASTR|nr:hypothetical protein L1987_17049 [Smallanthus sonchifolius]